MRRAIFLFITLITILTIATVSRQADSNFKYVSGSSVSKPVFPSSGIQNSAELDLARFSGKGITVLLYRAVSGHSEDSLCVSEEQFKEEMEWLYRNNYHTLNTDEFYEALVNGTPVPNNSVVITFDEQSAENYKAAWPCLQQYGFKATFLIATEYINPYSISWNQFNELVCKGTSTGSYTHRWDDFSVLTAQPQERELNDRVFYCPSGKFNKIILDYSGTGYRWNITAMPDKVSLGEDLFLLKQVCIREGMPIDSFAKLVVKNAYYG
ncbi:hypothetical protein SDC9_43985 [bioreactor metagenome]|uniref:NodB homology domain-containing protein n=1 Tax=bioreactor metagenome TaxID=1076179 RepID=A0A644W2X4_9ZZZZ